MTIALKMENRGIYLAFEFSGEFSVSAGAKCIDAMMAACAEHKCRRALFDCRKMTGTMSVMERLQVVAYAQKTRGIIDRIAIIAREDQVLPDKFTENVGVNRGIGLRIVTVAGQAISWLEEQ